jgi:hypothetical protein
MNDSEKMLIGSWLDIDKLMDIEPVVGDCSEPIIENVEGLTKDERRAELLRSIEKMIEEGKE